MIKPLYVIFDSKAGVYNLPFSFINNAVALRAAAEMLTGDTQLATNPEDFTMFRIGDFDDETAKVTQLDIPETLCRFHELKAQGHIDSRPAHVTPSDFDLPSSLKEQAS